MDSRVALWFCVLLFWCCAGVAWARRERILAQRKSSFNEVQVVQEGHQRILKVRQGKVFVEESRCDMRRPAHLLHQYSRLQMLASLFPDRLDRALVVGLGGGSLSKALVKHFPQLVVDSIELDPEIARLAQEYFAYRESERCHTFVADARVHLEKASQQYDLIVLDAFDGLEIPQPLRTRQFYELVSQRLRPGGVVASNLHRRSQNYDRDRVSLAQVFSHSQGFEGLGLVVVVSGLQAFQAHPERWSEGWGFAYQPLLKLLEKPGSYNIKVSPFED